MLGFEGFSDAADAMSLFCAEEANHSGICRIGAPRVAGLADESPIAAVFKDRLLSIKSSSMLPLFVSVLSSTSTAGSILGVFFDCRGAEDGRRRRKILLSTGETGLYMFRGMSAVGVCKTAACGIDASRILASLGVGRFATLG